MALCPPKEVDRPGKSEPAQKLLWCPFANVITPEMPTQSTYKLGYPRGAIVHYTAGDRGAGEIAYGAKMGFSYMVIDKAGKVYQATPLNRWGYHAGPSSWPGLSGISNNLVGIEVDCAGMVKPFGTSYQTWWGAKLDPALVRTSPAKDNIHPGPYEKFLPVQESALVRLLLWLKSNNPDVFDFDFVLGHDEVAPDRKEDPGGSLSLTMPEYREFLKKFTV